MPDPIKYCTPQQTFRIQTIGNNAERDASNSCQNGIDVYSVNIQSLKAHLAELIFQLEQYKPHIVLLQETWLDSSTEEVQIPGYGLVSRRDRSPSANRGGIATYQREDFGALVHVCNSEVDERSWHFLQLEADTILLVNWYRSPSSIHDNFACLYEEMSPYFSEVSGTLIMGDLNIHHKKWLRYSNGNTQIGTDLKAFCDYHGLFQLVKEPTRNDYLLDLAITDVIKSKASVLPQIADHRGIMTRLPLPEVLESQQSRVVWILKKANWGAITEELKNFEWSGLDQGSAEDALNHFLEVLWQTLLKHIPRKTATAKRSSHPWLNDICKQALLRKNLAQGSVKFGAERDNCTKVLHAERAKYVQELKARIAKLPKGSKEWWALNRELLQRKARVTSVPVLRDNGEWIRDPKGKANAFAQVFASKASLPPEAVDTPFFGPPQRENGDFVALRSRTTRRLLQKLDPATATGHDKLSAKILRHLADVIAVPFTRVCRRLFYEACWPTIWKYHLIIPIFKKGSAFTPGNYRGVHLTAILSKVAERLLGQRLIPFLQCHAFGDNQWAFTPGLSSRDLVTMLVMSWILAICMGKKVGGFLSDISGAFDRVFVPYLLAKLYEKGVGEDFLKFLSAYLAPRRGQVVVQGAFSDEFEIANSVFQGTVWGPPLWNTFFSDVAGAANSTGGNEEMFADDLNVFKEFDQDTSVDQVRSDLELCRKRVHKWGEKNRVSFDPSKEHIVIVHPSHNMGESFKLLGCMMDTDLRMQSAVDALLGKIRPKITAILRTRAYYTTADLIMQFKTHIWGLIEAHTGGFFHAVTGLLKKIDSAQNRFLHELHISPDDAFLNFNFAPPSLRRNIAILGLLHKRVLGKCHPVFNRLLPAWAERFPEPRGHGHNRQLYGHWVEISSHRALYNRSIFAMVDIYNNLPQDIINCNKVSAFQSALTKLARTRCQEGDAAWASTFNRRAGDNLDGPDMYNAAVD